MIDFFANLMIVTGGVICLIFWFVIVVAGLIELIDTLNKPKTAEPTILNEEDYS